MYKWLVYYVPLILPEFLMKLFTQANIQIKSYGFYIVDLFLYVLRLYVMTKNKWQIPERMTTSTMCHDEPKLYLNLVNFNIEYDSMGHTI